LSNPLQNGWTVTRAVAIWAVHPSRLWLERRRSGYGVVPALPGKKRRSHFQKASVAGIAGAIAQGHALRLCRPSTHPAPDRAWLSPCGGSDARAVPKSLK